MPRLLIPELVRPPNPRLQRTRWRSPLSRRPLGAAVQYGAEERQPTGSSPRKAASQSSPASTLAGPSAKSRAGGRIQDFEGVTLRQEDPANP